MARTRRRRGARRRVRQPAFFEAPGCKGSAVLREISYSGARLEAGEPLPPLRADVRLYIWPEGQSEPFELAGAVVGHRPDGFAVEYEEVGQHTCQMIDLLHAAAAADDGEVEPEAVAGGPSASESAGESPGLPPIPETGQTGSDGTSK